MERTYLSNAKVKEKWVSSKLCLEEEEDGNSCEVSWPAKNYSCSFCRREFRSAQALGGHMNVHRRDRARLRLLPSWISENSFTFSTPKLHPSPNSSPNPNPNPNSSSPNFSPFSYKHHSFSSSPSLNRQSSPFLASADGEKTSLASFSGSRERDLAKRKSTVGDSKGFGRKTEFDQVLKKEKIVSLDLKMGFLKDQKDDVDLELRLGYV